MGESYKIVSRGKCVLCGNDIVDVDNIFLCKDCCEKQKAMSGDKEIDIYGCESGNRGFE